jgi:hypothetical protein
MALSRLIRTISRGELTVAVDLDTQRFLLVLKGGEAVYEPYLRSVFVAICRGKERNQ